MTAVNQKDKAGRTPLFVACCKGNVGLVKSLLRSREINVNLGDNRNIRPLHIAAGMVWPEILRLLIDAGAQVNALDQHGQTPLNVLCLQYQDLARKDVPDSELLSCVKLLLEHGGDVNLASSNGWTPLHNICGQNANVKLAELLLKSGADPGAQKVIGVTPLMVACTNGFSSLVKVFIECNVDIGVINAADKDGDTTLHLAIHTGHPECVALLVKADADQSMQNKSGHTPMHLAIGRGHDKCVEALLGNHVEMSSISTKREPKTSISLPESDAFKTLLRGIMDRHSFESPPGETHTRPGTGTRRNLDGLLQQALQLSDESEKKADRTVAPIEKSLDFTGCRPMTIAQRFMTDLHLKGAYFNSSFNVCFCEVCHSKRGDDLQYTRGDPPKQYGLPVGWCKFGLRTKPQAEAENIFQKWHVAFHGTKVINLAKILETGDLLLPGDYTPLGDELKIPPNHWDPGNPDMLPPSGHDVNKFYFSPSIKYSGCNVYAPIRRWRDPASGDTHDIRVAFQVRIKPTTYDVNAQTIGARHQVDPLFPNSELEWSTRRRGVSILVGLLVKVEGQMKDADAQDVKQILGTETPKAQASFQEDTGSVKLSREYIYTTDCGVRIKLRAGDDCLLLSRSGAECVIMHPRVDDSFTIPNSCLK